MTPSEHTTQRDRVAASMALPAYADRVAVPRRPMVACEAAAAFLNAATAATPAPVLARTLAATFNVNRNTY